MRCPRCQFDNRDTAKFCEECGSRLVRTCPGCGYEVSPRANFCPECGTRLTATSPSPGLLQTDRQREAQTAQIEPMTAERGAPEAERRQLTVLFCDLVESTALAGRLDPEEFREVVQAYQAACAEVIQRYDGHIAQYLGDGLLVYFGYPRAHEDDARRAIHTGVGMVEAIGTLNTRLAQNKGIRLAVRVGIHTGLVVVGEVGGGGRQERLALGETPNVAARIQGIAAPDTVVVSAATLRLVQGFFSAADIGTHMLKGVATPVQVYRVLGESGAPSRLDTAVTRGLTPLVGRELEVTLLLERWAQVKEGVGQAVVLSGEPGIGKSRLVEVLTELVAEEPHTRLECRCSPYHQHSALYPMIDLLQRALAFTREDTPDEKVRKLEAALSRYHIDLQDTVPLFASLLSLPLPECYAPRDLTPQRQRQKTLETLLAMILEMAAQQPVLFVVEDLHWIDPSTLEFLTLLVDQGPTARIFTLFTCRREFRAPWGTRAHLTPITLNRLPRRPVETMVARVAGDKALPSAVVQQVVAKTDGVALFVEELTKMVLESGLLGEAEDRYELTGPLPPLAIPSTLHDSLMARLDRLAAVKEVAQLGGTLGRTFSYELLQAVLPLDETTLQQALARLIEAELLYQQGVPPQATYLFKHALIQEAAYQSLLKSTRQRYHQRIAQVLAERFPETAATQPELLAHHYTEAGLLEEAITHWQRAAERANERAANAEAVGHLTKGLELLQTLPDSPVRLQHELGLQIILGRALKDSKGYGDPEVARVYTRARELCQRMGETQQLFSVLLGLAIHFVVRAEFQTARELGEQLLRLARDAQDPVLLVEAHYALGVTFSWLGEFTRACAHLEEAIVYYDPRQHRSHIALYGQDGGPVCLSRLALVLWYLGYPDQALRRSQEALTLTKELSHRFSQAYVLLWIAWLYNHRLEVEETQERANAATAFSTEQGFPYWSPQGMILQGWALAEQGRLAEGMAQMRQGLDDLRTTGTEVTRAYSLGLLADAHRKVGQVQEGLALVAEALALVDKTGERWPEAELLRLQGELLLTAVAEVGVKPDLPDQVETCFRRALDVARRQQAKSWELRAGMSLSRLWRQQGKRAEARELLAPVYGWFTEGFDTADLQEAKALLQELA
jgi:TOMM system kinase/cyclase fusion protein